MPAGAQVLGQTASSPRGEAARRDARDNQETERRLQNHYSYHEIMGLAEMSGRLALGPLLVFAENCLFL